MILARVLSGVGRVLITVGTLLLLFVVYQLWGTGIHQAQAQGRLEKQFDNLVDVSGPGSEIVGDPDAPAPDPSAPDPGAVDPGDPGTTPEPSEDTGGAMDGPSPTSPTSLIDPEGIETPPLGDLVGKLEIPGLDLQTLVVEGVRDDHLKNGPGRYPYTPHPGQAGNAAVAGHRSTYGAPFAEIDQLKPGDPITYTNLNGQRFTYRVIDPDPTDDVETGHIIVQPNQTEVLADFGDNRLTLTACHPKYSAAQRIIVFAELVGEPLPTPSTVPVPEEAFDLSGERGSAGPAIVWALICAVVWLVAWLFAKRWRPIIPYAAGLPVFLVCLYFFFENFSVLLPTNF